MAIENRCFACVLVEPPEHRDHLIAMLSPVEGDLDFVHIPSASRGTLAGDILWLATIAFASAIIIGMVGRADAVAAPVEPRL